MHYKATRKAKQFFFLVLNYGIPLIALSYILEQLTHVKQSHLAGLQDPSVIDFKNVTAVCITLLVFSVVNWYLEAFKWQQSVTVIQQISLNRALEQCLVGASAGIFTPGKAGDYAVKAFAFPRKDRSTVLALNTFNNLMQLLTTCIFGCASLILLIAEAPELMGFVSIEKIVFGILVFTALSLTAFVVFKNRLLGLSKKIKKLFIMMTASMCLKIFLISVAKYLVFSFQFMTLLWLLGSQLHSYETFISISSIYVINSVIPSAALSDVMVKSGLGIVIFGLFGVSAAIVLSATTLMWLSNHIVPALIGSLTLLNNKSLRLY
jgi:hypothetical protein